MNPSSRPGNDDFFSSLLVPQRSHAQMVPCAERKATVEHLDQEFAESTVAVGMTTTGKMVEILASDAGKSWTMLVTMADGTACILASGESWEKLPSTAPSGPAA